MKVPLSWLKEYVDITEDIDTLCAKLVDIGFEVEEVVFLGKKVSNVKVCEIKEIAQHPNAERLLCCKVDIGGEIIPIVTNDHHLKIGCKVPVALHNATLATGETIKKGKMRGEESWGMFCGPNELGITKDFYENADADQVLVLRNSAVVGSDIRDEVGLNDYVLDVNITANRPDCNSVWGLAREVAVALGKECRAPEISFEETSVPTDSLVSVDVEATDICNGYFMQGLTDVRVAKSPVWMTSRLAKVGLHGINNLVDITNYVLWEIGQPMHAFDYADINGKTIIVRRAANNEKIVPLNGVEYVLTTDDLVIADKGCAVGLAGIMGGANSGIRESTQCVLFESATFARGNIRRTSRRLGLRSDSSARFEKGIETYTNNLGLSRALHLAQQLGCGKITSGRICLGGIAQDRVVTFRKERIKKLLGIEISDKTIISVLNSLNIQTSIKGANVSCVVPPYRDDISRDCDIVEELIRIYGYDNINGTLMENSHITCGGKTEQSKLLDKVRDIMVGLRFDECIFYPFGGKALFEKATLNGIDEDKYIKVKNPIGEELSMMNISLAPNMLQCVGLNFSRNLHDLRLFEIGNAYIAKSLPLTELPHEDKRLSIAATDIDFEHFRSVVMQVVHAFVDGGIRSIRSQNELYHGGISADVFVNDVFCGSFGKIHPQITQNFGIEADVYFAELLLEPIFGEKRGEIKYESFGKFPSVTRDFALVVEENVASQDILNEFLAVNYVCGAELFDVYRGEQVGAGKKSLAVSVEFRAADRTLRDIDVEKAAGKVLKSLEEKYGAVLR